MKFNERAISAAIKFFERNGYEDAHEYNGYVVAMDGAEAVIARVTVTTIGNDFREFGMPERSAMETVAAELIASGIYEPNTQIRFDDVQIHADAEGRALLRHQQNCQIQPTIPAMTLEALFRVLPEETEVIVYDDYTDDELARYDGRNSIPEKFNDWLVTTVAPYSGYAIQVWIAE